MRIYSVSEYREELNELMSQVTVVIEAEITSLNISQNRFVWFSLADDKCVIDCFMMTFALKVPLEAGMRVRVTGSPTMFKKGKVVFQPRQVELVGDGALQQAFELLKAQLEKEGLFDDTRKRALPRFPMHIGLLTSRDAAAYTDVLKILKNRWPILQVTLMHVQVQGDAAATSIVAGLEALYKHAATTQLDCIIVTRGGGSAEDLQAFNTEDVVRALFKSPVPTITAVGHERDTTLVDFVADLRAATPSNAAELLTPHHKDVQTALNQSLGRATRTLQLQLQQLEQRLTTLEQRTLQLLQAPLQRMDQLDTRLSGATQLLQQRIASKQKRVTDFESLLRQLHPQQLLKKGFTITRDHKGRIIKTVADANQQTQFDIQFTDGSVTAGLIKKS